MANVLIVEDEKAISDLILMNLRLVGHEGRQVFDGNEVSEVLHEFQPDLVLLDVMLPYKDGFSLMEQKIFDGTPVIFLTAKDSVIDKVKGLKLGADDYIVKPFETVELLARVEAVLRRAKPTERYIIIDNVSIHFDKREVTLNNKIVDLTNREFELLEVLINNRNIALSRDKLLDLAWGYDYFGDTRTVDVHITKLRKKLEFENRIKTIFKLGYRLEV
ncbi:MAG: response regulator transcription factor [Oscillospiraceae bacterium]|nr:response regulator transcription factor [Oscillospiraceae bacterium]